MFMAHNYQRYCTDRMVRQENVGIWIAPGLGKTAVTLMAVKELIRYRFRVRRVLVIAPKKVAESTWTEEAAKWIQTKDLRFSLILGTATQRRRALPESALADIYLTNRENVVWLVNQYVKNGECTWPFDMVVIDESSSFKSQKAKRWKALAKIRPHIRRMVELTGTPSPNGVEDLWAQVALLDDGERLGKTFYGFRNRYFTPADRNYHTGVVYKYTPKPGSADAILSKIEDLCITMKSEDYLDLPERIDDVIPVKLSQTAQRRYHELERTMVTELAESGEEITVTSAAALTGKLLQMAGGAVYDEEGTVHVVGADKLDRLAELAEQLAGEHALVFYHYRHELSRIQEVLSKSWCVRTLETADDIRDWNAGNIDFLIAHPASSGYGLNLQAGGHHIIWYGLTWNYELYEQACKRLHRQGQSEPVIVHHLVAKDTKDELVMQALRKKESVQDAVMESLKAEVRKAREQY